LDEQELVVLARTGDTDAFGEIVRHYKFPVLRYLYRLTGDMEKAEDLTQDTFVKAFEGINGLRSQLALKSWLYRIATRTAHSYWRRNRLRVLIHVDDSKSPNSIAVEDSMRKVEEKMVVRRSLLEVPQHQRVCLVLHYVEGFKYREIAETLGISEDAVRKRISRGKQAFRRFYNGGGDQ
jgi:RNA polymerase sigma-70 factor (ECF subfamily)